MLDGALAASVGRTCGSPPVSSLSSGVSAVGGGTTVGRVGRTVADIASLLRIHAAGFEALVFVLGPMLGGWRGQVWEFAALWSIGIVVNGYIFVLNDLVDLPYDRANPKRVSRPLVDGRVSTQVALGLSIAFPLVALMIALASNWPSGAVLAFAAVLVIGAYVNIYQKITRRPLLMDLLHATAMASPVPICSFAVLHRLTALTWCATTGLFLLALQLNSIAGNLKDLEPDRQAGFCTVALTLGAAIAPDRTLRAGRRYSQYCWGLQALTVLALSVALVDAVHYRPVWQIVAVTLPAVIAVTVGTWDLAHLLGGRRPPSQTGRELYFASGFAILLLIVAARSHMVVFLVSLAMLAIWTSGFAIYEQSRILVATGVSGAGN